MVNFKYNFIHMYNIYVCKNQIWLFTKYAMRERVSSIKTLACGSMKEDYCSFT